MPYARIINNVALDVTEQDPTTLFTDVVASEFSFIDFPNLKHGAKFINNTWINPEENIINTPNVISVYSFRSRFTNEELLWLLSLDDLKVKLLLLKIQTRIEIDLNDPVLITGMNYLVSLGGLLTLERVEEIIK